MDNTLQQLYDVILRRRAEPQEGSYTCYLFDKGLDKILKKVGGVCRDHHCREKRCAGGDGGGDIRPDLPPAGDDGRTKYPPFRCNGGTGPEEPENRKSKAVPRLGP